MIGLLITLACIVILMSVSLTALNRALTGEGSAISGTVHSTQDMIRLNAIYQSMLTGADRFQRSQYIVPGTLAAHDDRSVDTTANLYSAMVMYRYVRPDDLISANEFNGYVQSIPHYDYQAYDPARGVHWDDSFQADLHRNAHVSFAHMPLFGERFERGWRATMNHQVLLLGNRGPENGIHNPASMTYGRNQQWGGHIVRGDGSISFIDTFTPDGLTTVVGGERRPDNIFAMESGPYGDDAILSFTREMTSDGPVLQFD